MLHEKADESFHWKNKLDNLEHLPGEAPFEKAGAWEKLYHQLQKPAGRRKEFWIRIAAAACLLIAIGIFWLKMDRKAHPAIVHRSQPQTAPPRIHTIPFEIKTSPVVSTLPVKEKTGMKTRVKNIKPFFLTPVDTTENITTIKVPVIDPIMDIPQPEKKDDTLAFASSKPVKKKMRVVHFNELNSKTEEPSEYAKNKLNPLFQEKRMKEEAFPGIVFSSNATDDILKIKLPHTN